MKRDPKLDEKKTPKRTGVSIGIASGVFSLLCCVSPIVLVLLGLSTVAGALSLSYFLFDNFKFYFLAASGIFFVVAMYIHLRRRGQCSVKGIKKNRNTIILSLIAFASTFVFLYYFTTWLGDLAEQYIAST